MRQGFGLIQALIVIVLISGIIVIAMKYATVSVKHTSDTYMRESAELFLNSAVELALLAISGHDRSVGCLHDINITSSDNRYLADINITHYFYYQGVDGTPCDRAIATQTEESHGMALLHVTVYTNSLEPKNQAKKIRLTRRTLQRP